jgi:hypothetical protein
MMSGWCSGQPVAKAVTKSAEVDRVVFIGSRYPFVFSGGARRGERPVLMMSVWSRLAHEALD